MDSKLSAHRLIKAFTPNWLPSPNRRLKPGKSKGVDIMSISRIPANINTDKLEPGITSDKHGMIIINNEKIIEIIKGEVAS